MMMRISKFQMCIWNTYLRDDLDDLRDVFEGISAISLLADLAGADMGLARTISVISDSFFLEYPETMGMIIKNRTRREMTTILM